MRVGRLGAKAKIGKKETKASSMMRMLVLMTRINIQSTSIKMITAYKDCLGPRPPPRT